MKWNTLKYLFKEGLLGLWKNRLMALASIGTIILCLMILGMSYSIVQNIAHVLNQVETRFGITAYVNGKVDDNRINKIRQQIEVIPNVIHVEYISKEKALEIFSKDENSDKVFDQFKDDNPLPASFELQVKGIQFQEQVVNELKNIPELQISYFEKEMNMFMKVNQSIQLVSGVITICLVIIGLLLINNTIKLTVYVRRKEINIMKYIGATDWFIRLPFLVEGVTIGLIGSLISISIIYGAYKWTADFMMNHLGSVMQGISLCSSAQIMRNLTIMFLIIGVGIGLLGSGIAIRKHLKV